MAGVGLVAAGDDDRRALDPLERVQVLERARARYGLQRVGDRVGVLVAGDALAHERRDRFAHGRRQPLHVVGREIALDAALAQPRGERVVAAQALLAVEADGVVGGRDDDEAGDALGDVEREAQDRVRAHRAAGEHRALELEAVEQRQQVGAEVVVAVGVGGRRR